MKGIKEETLDMKTLIALCFWCSMILSACMKKSDTVISRTVAGTKWVGSGINTDGSTISFLSFEFQEWPNGLTVIVNGKYYNGIWRDDGGLQHGNFSRAENGITQTFTFNSYLTGNDLTMEGSFMHVDVLSIPGLNKFQLKKVK